jgi:GNAT superfamily N-acetyltransferase
MSMRRHGIGKGLIAKIYEVAKAHNYSLFLVLMTEIFFQPNGEARRCRHR